MGMLEAPHDTFFRAVLGQPAYAASWLGSVLPQRIVRAIDWSTLAAAPDTALGVRFRRHHADLVFTATLPNGATVLLVVEHKAQPDPDLASQLLRYVVHLRRAARRRNGGPEPLVLAVVLHHGPRPLPGTPPHPHLTLLPAADAEAFAALQPQVSFVVDDLAACADEPSLHRHGLRPAVQLALLCLRCLRDGTGDDVLAAFARWAVLLRAVDRDDRADTVDAVCWYALAVTEVAPEALTDVVSRILHRPEDTIMSTLERTYQKGKAEGKAEGEAKGKAEGRAETILRMLHKRFGELPAEIATRVRTGSLADLDRWTDRILDAATLAELFAD